MGTKRGYDAFAASYFKWLGRSEADFFSEQPGCCFDHVLPPYTQADAGAQEQGRPAQAEQCDGLSEVLRGTAAQDGASAFTKDLADKL